MSAAIVSSIAPTADKFLARLLAADPPAAGAQALVGPVAETIGARRDEASIGNTLQQTAGLAGPNAASRQRAVLEGLVRGLGGGKPEALRSEQVARGLERLLASSSPEVSQLAVRVAGLLQLSDSPAMQAAWVTALKTALDTQRPLQGRLDAVSLLKVAPWSQVQALRGLLDARQPTELQLAVVQSLGHSDHPAVAEALVANWSGLVPKVQESVVDAFFARQDRLPGLLDAVQREVVPAVTLSALRREQLIEHSNPAIRQQARLLLASRITDDRAAVLQRYASALTLPRDPRRGEAVYEKTCAKCHRLGNKGHEVGPDLLAARTRPDETLLIDVLDPSSALAHGFTVYSILTSNGRVHTGLLASDSATSVTLRSAAEPTAAPGTAAVVETTILRKDIDEMRALSKSLMPDGMEKELTPQDVGEDAMIYKIVEEDAWLSVLFGPPFSEFYLEFRLAVSDDGSFEVIGCELLPEPGEE